MYIPKLEIYKYCRIPSGSNEKEPYPNLLSRKSLLHIHILNHNFMAAKFLFDI